MPWEWPVGALLAFVIALVTTPAGVSGAVLLLPVQVSVLAVPNPVVTPTNLLFNVLATPGALARFAQERRLFGPLLGLLVAGTLPGVAVGAVVRVELLADASSFALVIGLVLLPLGLWLLLGGQRRQRPAPSPSRRLRIQIWTLALLAGVVGGIYGVGGGSLLAPILLMMGYSAYQVAPATLGATFLTSIAGIATFQALQLGHQTPVGPDWMLGVFLGVGGLAGSYCGARLQRHIPELALRRLLGVLACLVACRYLQLGTTATASAQAPCVPTLAAAQHA